MAAASFVCPFRPEIGDSNSNNTFVLSLLANKWNIRMDKRKEQGNKNNEIYSVRSSIVPTIVPGSFRLDGKTITKIPPDETVRR